MVSAPSKPDKKYFSIAETSRLLQKPHERFSPQKVC